MRKRFFLSISGLVVCSVLACLVLSSVQVRGQLSEKAQWAKNRYDNYCTGRCSYQGFEDNDLRWTFGAGCSVYNSVAVGSEGTIYFGNENGKLYAVNPDGTKKWSFGTGAEIRSTPAIGSEGTIYFGNENGKLYAVNPDGTKKWSNSLGGPTVYSPPTVFSPTLASDGTIYVSSTDGRLYAVRPDGVEKWNLKVGETLVGTPAFDADGRIYVCTNQGKVFAINSDGTEKWSFSTNGYILSSPAIGSNGVIYVTSEDGKLYALQSDGTKKWSFSVGNYNIDSSPAIGPYGAIYITTVENRYPLLPSSALIAVNQNGTEKWAFPTGNPNGPPESSPVVDGNGTIYFGSWDGKLYAVNPDGTKKWSFQTDDSIYSSPSISSDGTVYIGSTDGNLYAIGKEKNQHELKTSSNPVDAGSIMLNPSGGTYNEGTKVEVLADPAEGYKFDYWTGDYPSDQAENSSITVTMDSDKSLTAYFSSTLEKPGVETLEASPVRGTEARLRGELTDMGGADTVTVGFYLREENGTWRKHILEGLRDPGIFVDWRRDLKTGTTYEFRAFASNDVGESKGGIKDFHPSSPEYTLNTSVNPMGGGSIDLDPGDGAYEEEKKVKVTAEPASGYVFDNWTGDYPSGHKYDNYFALTMDSDKSLTAHFVRVGKVRLVRPERTEFEAGSLVRVSLEITNPTDKARDYRIDFFTRRDREEIEELLRQSSDIGDIPESWSLPFGRFPIKHENFSLEPEESELMEMSWIARPGTYLELSVGSVTDGKNLWKASEWDVKYDDKFSPYIDGYRFSNYEVSLESESRLLAGSIALYIRNRFLPDVPVSYIKSVILPYVKDTWDRVGPLGLCYGMSTSALRRFSSDMEPAVEMGQSEVIDQLRHDQVPGILTGIDLNLFGHVIGKDVSAEQLFNNIKKDISGGQPPVLLYDQHAVVATKVRENKGLNIGIVLTYNPNYPGTYPYIIFDFDKNEVNYPYVSPPEGDKDTIHRMMVQQPYYTWESAIEDYGQEIWRNAENWIGQNFGNLVSVFSPVNVKFIDVETGKVLSPTENNISGGKVFAVDNGWSFLLPKNGKYKVIMEGTENGTVHLYRSTTVENQFLVEKAQFKVYKNTSATFEMESGKHTKSIKIDKNNDEKNDNQILTSTVIGPSRTYRLTTTIHGKGTLKTNPTRNNYKKGTKVTVTAESASGYEFDHWSGDVPGASKTITVTMDENKNLTAHFIKVHTLRTSSNPTNGGFISLSPSRDKYRSETEVTVRAKTSEGYEFDHWSGDVFGTSKTKSIIMDSDKAITAHFVKVHTLTTSAEPSEGGSISTSPSKDNYEKGTQITITAQNSEGYKFDHWSGDLSGTSKTKTVTITSDMNFTAHFAEAEEEKPEGEEEGGGLPLIWIGLGTGAIIALVAGILTKRKG